MLANLEKLLAFGRQMDQTAQSDVHNQEANCRLVQSHLPAITSKLRNIWPKNLDAATVLASSVSAKREDGNITAALRAICSEYKTAPNADEVYAELFR